jgi:DNA-directed RNA polymerase specialized sigma24 family protein
MRLMREPVQVTTLVHRANNGDQEAWNATVDRYAPLVWSICRRFRLADADTGDATQTVWPPLCQKLLALLVKVPPLSYAEAAEKLEMAIGSISPTRARCLGKLRDCPIVATLQSPTATTGAGGLPV